MTGIEIALFTKSNGPLTKRISLDEHGNVQSDGSACRMAHGKAERLRLDGVADLSHIIEVLEPEKALALGALRDGLGDAVEIIAKARINGIEPPDLVARTGSNFIFRPGQPAFALCDFDRKDMPAEVAAKIDSLGGFEMALIAVIPELSITARVRRASTSSGLYHAETGEPLPGSGGEHLYLEVSDGADVDRFTRTLHERCCLGGLGWYTVGVAGQLLERSIVDRSVGGSERLVFEGAPILVPPVEQHRAARRPIAIGGKALDSVHACPQLTVLEQAALRELRAKAAATLAPERTKAKAAYIKHQAERLVQRTGMSVSDAARVIERQAEGMLLPHVVLPFDDPDLAGCTVADVLADPERFIDETLADPIEGVAYGPGKAKILRRADGTIWIHSFAHGGAAYSLKLDYRAVAATLKQVPVDGLVDAYLRLVLAAELNAAEIEQLRNAVHKRTGTGKRVLDQLLREANKSEHKRQQQAERERRAAERQDPRPQLPAPAPDAEWLPVITAVTEILCQSPWPEPPMRDPDGHVVQIWRRRVTGLHMLSAAAANAETDESPLPPPEQALITRLDEPLLAELIEKHVEFVARNDAGVERAVHLDGRFVRHLIHRQDDIPTVTAVATLPVVLDDGILLARNGLARDYGTVFRVPMELLEILPRPQDCTRTAVGEAMRFLIDEWLVDVTASYAHKCVLISCALTIIERVLLAERPAFFVIAGQRGGGKTTTINMISLGVLGTRAPAAAWSKHEEERRKALFSYLLEGMPFLCWDNIAKGALISCPSIEKALTAESYADRVLGESRSAAPQASMIQAFTGNNVGPRGDLASRSLLVQLTVDRPDPENRKFRHPDPFSWTLRNRGEILAALYTILIGNPRRGSRAQDRTPAPTRFKTWWELVGSAVEYAAAEHAWLVAAQKSKAKTACMPEEFEFKDRFLAVEADDEQVNATAEVIGKLNAEWPAVKPTAIRQRGDRNDFDAAAVMQLIDEDAEFRTMLEQAAGDIKEINAKTLTRRLKALRDAPVRIGRSDNQVIVALRYAAPDKHQNTRAGFWLEQLG